MSAIIYETRGAAKEYCELALDIYTGCKHGCKYCYAKDKAEKNHEDFDTVCKKVGFTKMLDNYLSTTDKYKGRTIFLGFSSDPFPYGEDCSDTIETIKILKKHGCHVMFCTKGSLDSIKYAIDLLDEKDSVGITITCGDEMASIYEANSNRPSKRLEILKAAHEKGCETWISIEPVLEPKYIYSLLESEHMNYVTRVKLGKLNHMNISDLTGNKNDFIDWTEYAHTAINLCKKNNIEYVVKSALKSFI